MVRWAPAVAALGFTIGAPSAPAAPPERHASLRLLWSDPQGALKHRLLTRGFSPMAREVIQIFADAGIAAEWTELTRDALASPDDAIPVVVVLTTARPERWGLAPNTLGAVMGRGGPVRCVYVFHEEVVRTLQLPRRRSSGDFHSLGRAIGRVAAHEIVHALTPDRPHSRVGLMKEELDRQALSAVDRPSPPLSGGELMEAWSASTGTRR